MFYKWWLHFFFTGLSVSFHCHYHIRAADRCHVVVYTHHETSLSSCLEKQQRFSDGGLFNDCPDLMTRYLDFIIMVCLFLCVCYSGFAAKVLQKAQVRIINHSTCNDLMKGQLTSRMLCAGVLSGGVDACQVIKKLLEPQSCPAFFPSVSSLKNSFTKCFSQQGIEIFWSYEIFNN